MIRAELDRWRLVGNLVRETPPRLVLSVGLTLAAYQAERLSRAAAATAGTIHLAAELLELAASAVLEDGKDPR